MDAGGRIGARYAPGEGDPTALPRRARERDPSRLPLGADGVAAEIEARLEAMGAPRRVVFAKRVPGIVTDVKDAGFGGPMARVNRNPNSPFRVTRSEIEVYPDSDGTYDRAVALMRAELEGGLPGFAAATRGTAKAAARGQRSRDAQRARRWLDPEAEGALRPDEAEERAWASIGPANPKSAVTPTADGGLIFRWRPSAADAEHARAMSAAGEGRRTLAMVDRNAPPSIRRAAAFLYARAIPVAFVPPGARGAGAEDSARRQAVRATAPIFGEGGHAGSGWISIGEGCVFPSRPHDAAAVYECVRMLRGLSAAPPEDEAGLEGEGRRQVFGAYAGADGGEDDGPVGPGRLPPVGRGDDPGVPAPMRRVADGMGPRGVLLFFAPRRGFLREARGEPPYHLAPVEFFRRVAEAYDAHCAARRAGGGDGARPEWAPRGGRPPVGGRCACGIRAVAVLCDDGDGRRPTVLACPSPCLGAYDARAAQAAVAAGAGPRARVLWYAGQAPGRDRGVRAWRELRPIPSAGAEG